MSHIMKQTLFKFAALLFFVSMIVFPVRAGAEDRPAPIEAGRFNYIQGSVVVQQEGGSDWFESQVNYPVASGDRVWANADARAEVITSNGVIFRMGELTSLIIGPESDNDGYRQVSVTLPEGKLYVNAANATVDVNLQRALIRSGGDSRYRVDTFDDGTVQVFVLQGSLTVSSDLGTQQVKEGELYNLVGGAKVEMSALPPHDDFDQWNLNRDQGNESQIQYAQEYLPSEVTEVYPNLNSYGNWTNIDTYGYCWVPRVAATWSPFYDGRWIYWRNNYTWVSYEPWGWAPYHYGRWAFGPRYGWFWVPPVHRSVFWTPGAVAWYQGYDSVFWVPLAPREYYYGYGYFGPYSINAININFNYFSGRDHHKNYYNGHGFVGAPRGDFFHGKHQHYDPNKFKGGGGNFAYTPYPNEYKMRRNNDMPYKVSRRSDLPPSRALDTKTWGGAGRSSMVSSRGGHPTDQGAFRPNNGQPERSSSRANVATSPGRSDFRSGNEMVRNEPQANVESRHSTGNSGSPDRYVIKRDAPSSNSAFRNYRPSATDVIRPSGDSSRFNNGGRRDTASPSQSQPTVNRRPNQNYDSGRSMVSQPYNSGRSVNTQPNNTGRSAVSQPYSTGRSAISQPQPVINGNDYNSRTQVSRPSRSAPGAADSGSFNRPDYGRTNSAPSTSGRSFSRQSGPVSQPHNYYSPNVRPNTGSSSVWRGGSGRSYAVETPTYRGRSSSGGSVRNSSPSYGNSNSYQSGRSTSSGGMNLDGGGRSSFGGSWGGMSRGGGGGGRSFGGGGRR